MMRLLALARRPEAPERTGRAELTPAEIVETTFRDEIVDAVELLAFAVTDGRPVPDPVVDAITAAGKAFAAGTSVDAAAFAKAYRQLAALLAPVTAVSLRATCDQYGRTVWLLAPREKRSEAKLWSRKLWLWTIGFCLLIVANENAQQLLAQADHGAVVAGTWQTWLVACCPLLGTLVPFAYGALGACASLLRACHQYLHDRSFDPIHTPEYQSRMLLGAVSGGTVLLFAEYLSPSSGKIPLSGAALAFLAGYSNDFLFNLIERLVAALLPRTGATDPGSSP